MCTFFYIFWVEGGTQYELLGAGVVVNLSVPRLCILLTLSEYE